MGNHVSSSRQDRSAFLQNLPQISFQAQLGASKLLKTIQGVHEKEGLVVVRVYFKRDTISLAEYAKKLGEIRSALTIQNQPNVLAYQFYQENERAAYLVRQFFAANLYDRFSTRPFLTPLEKQWIAFQILSAVDQLHSANLCHGDIKTENIMVTTWGWVFLSDIASYKPTYLPDDDPADFSFFFDTSGRQKCYLAPERFYAAGANLVSGPVTTAMDIFSLGCTLAELFSEGDAIFHLPQLLTYRKGQFDPAPALNKITDPAIQKLILHMIQIDPSSRHSIKEYLRLWNEQVFCKTFPYLFDLLKEFLLPEKNQPDVRIQAVDENYDSILQNLGVKPDDEGDSKVDSRVSSDISKDNVESADDLSRQSLLIIVNLLCSSVRNARSPRVKKRAVQLLCRLSRHVSDSVILQRIVPYIISCLSDGSATVRTAAVHALSDTLSTVRSLTPADTNVFPEYILPSLSLLPDDPEETVQIAYAECISSLTETGRKFLELSQSMKQDTWMQMNDDLREQSHHQENYDAALGSLQDTFARIVVRMLTGSNTHVKRVLLSDIVRLCIFFDRVRTNTFVLPLLITFLNDRDHELRSAFFRHIVGISAFVSPISLQEFILPCIEQALLDVEDLVIESALLGLASLCRLGLFNKRSGMDIVRRAAPLLLHPNTWIREAATSVISDLTASLHAADVYAFLRPIIRPFLKFDLVSYDSYSLGLAVKSPVSRLAYNQALSGQREAAPSSSEPDADSEGLVLMQEYVNLAAVAYRSKPNQLATEQTQWFELELQKNPLKVHSVTIPDPHLQNKRTKISSRSADWISNELTSSNNSSKALSPSNGIGSGIDSGVGSSVNWLDWRIAALNIPCDPPDLGALRREDGSQLSVYSVFRESLRDWKPKGVLVTTLYEHAAAVNHISVSQDNRFFVTGSDDGLVKLWDSELLDRDVTAGSRITYKSQSSSTSSRVRALTMCENSHSVAVGFDNGYIDIFRVEYAHQPNPADRYNGVTNIAQVTGTSSIVSLHHFNTDNESILVYALRNGEIYGWDLRSRKPAFECRVPCPLVTCTTVFGDRYVVAGTRNGHILTWDIRSSRFLTCYQHSSGSPVRRLEPFFPQSLSATSPLTVFAACGSAGQDVALWDLSNGSCQHIFMISDAQSEEVVSIPSLRPSSPTTSIVARKFQSFTQKTTRALLCPRRHLEGPSLQYALVGGSDGQLRYWDLDTQDTPSSYMVSQLEGKAKRLYVSNRMGDVLVTQEQRAVTSANATLFASSRPQGPAADHQDCITDLAVTDSPTPTLISAGRDGIVRLWR
eukprot:GILK01008305.1.p1 GENE.GILK01008305.1~~GILK01008305.1.p1  ORF type:complete len:1294 (-),score=251.52 GILK01008305.1:386-4267(-)